MGSFSAGPQACNIIEEFQEWRGILSIISNTSLKQDDATNAQKYFDFNRLETEFLVEDTFIDM